VAPLEASESQETAAGRFQDKERPRMMNHWMDFPGMGFGVTHWVVFAAFVAAFLYPVGRILDRIGFSPLWSVVALIPLVNLIALWVLAFSDWPRNSGRPT
jgi:hypothetical protein